MLEILVPGKLYIAGEYSILKAGNQAIVASVNRFMKFNISESNGYGFYSKQGEFTWDIIDGEVRLFSYDLYLAQKAIKIAIAYLLDQDIFLKTFKISVDSELDSTYGIKYGLGSSATIVVGLLKSIFLFHGLDIDPMTLFKLAVLVQIEANQMSSGGDLAATIYTGWVFYQKYDLAWLIKNLDKGFYLLDMNWPSLNIEKLKIDRYCIAAGWTEYISDTDSYLQKFSEKANNKPWYNDFLANTQAIVLKLKEALQSENDEKVKELVLAYRIEMKKLQNKTNLPIESPLLETLIKDAKEYGLAAKISGAGFGDCGIIVYAKEQKARVKELFETWKNHLILPLELDVWELSF